MKSRAGIAQQLTDEEFPYTVAAWVEVLYGHVPEHRLNDVYVHVSRTRNTTFPLTQFELCEAWNQIKAAERMLRPTQKPGAFAKDVCPDCNGTGTRLFKKMDFELGREYTNGGVCQH